MLYALVGILPLLFCLFLILGKSPGEVRLSYRDAPLYKDLPNHLQTIAKEPPGRGKAALRVDGSILRRLEKEVGFLSAFPDAELLPGALWLVENGRYLQEKAASATEHSLKKRCLPMAKNGESRVLTFAREYVGHCTAEVNQDSLSRSLAAWQQASPFSQQELCLLPQAMDMALLSIIDEMCRLCYNEQTARRDADRMLNLLERKDETKARKFFDKHRHQPAFLQRLLYGLEGFRENPFPLWLERFIAENSLSRDALTKSRQEHQTESSLWLSNAITSLHTLSHMPWDKLLEQWNPLHPLLLQDEVYPTMDAESRAYYRSAVHRLSLRLGKPEAVITEAAFSLAEKHSDEPLFQHVGYWLLDSGRQQLVAHLRAGKPIPLLMDREKRFLLLRLCAWGLFLLSLGIGLILRVPLLLLAPFGAVLFSGLQHLAQCLYCRYAPAKMVPRIEVNALGEKNRTLVICPTLLNSREQALAMVKHLSVLHSANPDPNLHFLLLGDYRDSLTPTMGDDEEIVAAAAAATKALREDTGHPFFYFQRERVFHAPDHLHMSRERKRGSVETLLKLTQGMPIEDTFAYASLPPEKLQGRYRYVITLDSDTFLPPGAAHRMVGAMLHPLTVRQKIQGRMRGAGILQPRMEVMASSVKSSLSLLLGSPGGSEPYNALHTDFYAGLFQSGNFAGKGIIDPAAFLAATENKIVPGLILSHDLLEGQLCGCAYASDIVLYESHPSALKGFMYRHHRWIRGDWQLLCYLLPFYPNTNAEVSHALNTLSRHKLWQNLLRSVISPLKVLLLLFFALTGRPLLFLLVLLPAEIPSLFPFTKNALFSLLARLASMPVFAAMEADAIVRSLYRQFVSHENLLKWTTAAQLSNPTDKPPMLPFYIGAGAAGCMLACSLAGGYWALPGFILSSMWALFPLVSPLLEQPSERTPYPTGYMREILGKLARETLLYYDTSITEDDHGLPPDNVQVEPNKGISHRTSPTNIGLYMVALIASEKMRLLSLDQLCRRMEAAVESLEKTEKWHGHPYNWIDTRSLAPMQPRFVSSVDSGNLAVCLLTAAQGLRMLLAELPPRFQSLPQRLDDLAGQMDFRPLFDYDAELFRIGILPETPEKTHPHYDLLASESRLLSFVSISMGQIPIRHWYRLGRNRVHTQRGQTLLSSNGTMFEYMMPLLFHRPVRGTLLDAALRTVMKVQAAHRLGGAYGVSESGYYAFDPQLFYQYKAFGLPSLSLKAEVDDRVLAPYASVLTLPLKLKPAFLNLLRLRSLGLEGPLGLFEAADFCKSRIDKGKPFQIVRSHMAHHQGMILITICNVLNRWYIADLFGSLPKVQAHQPLLEEKNVKLKTFIKRPLKRRISTPETASEAAVRQAQPLTLPMDAHLLYGGGTSLVVDAQGGGYLSRDGVMLTRFREECHIPSGLRLFMKDSQSGAYWSLTDPAITRSVIYESAQAVFLSERFHVDTELRIFINPLDGAAVHFVTLKNLTKNERMLEICSYLEPALTPLREDNAHPAFQNLFMQTKKLGKYGVCLRKRPKEERAQPLLLWHTLTADTPFHLFRIQTDRSAFLGRGRTVHNPRSMEMPVSGFADSLGDAIEPCLSLRGQFVLPAEGKIQLAFITHCPSAKDSESAFLERYNLPENALRTYRSAATQAHVTAQYLGLSAKEEAQVFRLAGCIAYTGQPMQFRFSSGNTLPPDGLPAMNLSPERPFLLVEVPDLQLELVHLLMKAHALFRMGGLWFDLVLLSHSASGTEEEALRLIKEVILNSPSADVYRKESGVHLSNARELTREQQSLLRAAARLVLSTKDGALSSQLDRMTLSLKETSLYRHKPSAAWKHALPSMEELQYDNEFGGFTSDGNYTILLPPGRQTPAPWCNPLCSDSFGTLAAESGLVFTYVGNSQLGRLCHWPNDAVSPRSDENFFLKDGEHKLIWSLTRFPLAQGLPCRIRYAPGEAVYETSGYGIYSRLTCFTDMETTLGVRVIQIRNEDKTERSLMLCHSFSFRPGSLPAGSQLTSPERTEKGVTAGCPPLDGAVCLAGIDPLPTYCAAISDGAFYGLGGPVPYALAASDTPHSDGGNTALNCYTLQIKPGESKTIVAAVGYGVSKARLERAVQSLTDDGATQRLHRVKQSWEQRLSALQFDLPDPLLSIMLNRWLPYQTLASRLMMRAGFYQSGGATGFRDQLQDMLALIHTDPQTVREHLLRCAARQYEEGDVQHWWHEETVGIRTRISDDMLFLPYIAALYIGITGDKSLLAEPVPYLHSPALAANETDRVEKAEPSAIIESFQQHCFRAIDRVPFGQHGLPLMGGGDWNDGLNRAGGEKGESVWLGMFLCEVLRRFSPYCDPANANRFAGLRIRLIQALDKFGWDGNWYLRGWYSMGDPLGSADSAECMLTLIPQCWAVFSGLSRERCATAMDSAWEYLWEPDIGILKLLAPPFNGAEDPGYIAAYIPGVRENGGQYTHGAVWAMAAWYQLGKYDRAWELALSLLPQNHALTRQTAARYRVEPYVMAADIYSNPRHRGRGGWTWYTGSAAWYQYLMLTELLGFRKTGSILRFRPVLPAGWDWVRITYRYGSTTYHLHGRRDCPFPMADGERLKEGSIILRDDGKIHEGVFPIRG